MTLLIDRSSTSGALRGEDFYRWAEQQTVFISSEMEQLASERAAVAAALREAGMRVVLFEDLGGRDDDAVTAYLDGVAQSQIYVGIVADRYGRMQDSGRSPTHDEYLAARDQGKSISFWVAHDGSNRQGHARDFVQEVQTFHTTGGFQGAEDLAGRVMDRMAELAADSESPWVKIGEAVFRANVIRDLGDRIEIEADIRDPAVVHFLETLRGDEWNRTTSVQLTTSDRSGELSVDGVASETRSTSRRSVHIDGAVRWANGAGNSMAAGTAGYSAEDLVEVGFRAGLLREPLPEALGGMDFLVDSADPLEEMPTDLPQSTLEAVARLMVVERLVGSRQAERLEQFSIGPVNQNRRRINLVYVEPRRYANVVPDHRLIEGERPAD